MHLREWCSNDKFMRSIPMTDKLHDDQVKILGISWNTKKDLIEINCRGIDRDNPTTKRYILKEVAALFDPMGIFCPIVTIGKLILQTLWQMKSDWD